MVVSNLVYIVNVSDGKVLLNTISQSPTVIGKGQVLSQAFPSDTLQQNAEFMRFYSKGLLKLVADPAKVSSSASVTAAPTITQNQVVMERQIDELNDRIHAGEPPIPNVDGGATIAGEGGADRDLSKPATPVEEVDKTAVLTEKAKEAAAGLHASFGQLLVEDSVVVTTSSTARAPLATASEEAPGAAGSLQLDGATVPDDLPTAVIPPTSQDAKDLIAKDPKAFKITVSKSRDMGLLREVTYGVKDLELRKYAWARVKKLDSEGD